MQQISDEAYEAYLKERGLSRTQYTTMELLAVASAREVPDGAFVFAGTGLPLLASMLAQFTVAPNMTLIMETCDRIVVLDQGRTLAEGTPAEVRANLDVAAAYLGESAVAEDA